MKRDAKNMGLNPLSFIRRELSKEERIQRAIEIEDSLARKGGVIVAISCKDGILLAGVSPDGDSTFFDVFDRIGLLGIGDTRDCKTIHSFATGEAYSTMLLPSKADIDSREIAEQISNELDECFSYQGGQRGPYKANFIIVELGFNTEEDFIELINYSGGNEIRNVPRGKLWKIYEVPTVSKILVPKEQVEETYNFIQANPKVKPEEVQNFVQTHRKVKGKDDQKSESKKNENKEDEEKIYELRLYRVPTIDAFDYLLNSLYSKDNIPTVQEAALFVGLLVRLFNKRGGRLEMVYLDRNMLQKTKTEGRRFHYILNRITNFDPRKPSDPLEDWKKFVASIYRKVKKGKGELPSEYKYLIDCFEIIEEQGLNEETEKILKKLGKGELLDLMTESITEFLKGKKKD